MSAEINEVQEYEMVEGEHIRVIVNRALFPVDWWRSLAGTLMFLFPDADVRVVGEEWGPLECDGGVRWEVRARCQYEVRAACQPDDLERSLWLVETAFAAATGWFDRAKIALLPPDEQAAARESMMESFSAWLAEQSASTREGFMEAISAWRQAQGQAS